MVAMPVIIRIRTIVDGFARSRFTKRFPGHVQVTTAAGIMSKTRFLICHSGSSLVMKIWMPKYQ